MTLPLTAALLKGMASRVLALYPHETTGVRRGHLLDAFAQAAGFPNYSALHAKLTADETPVPVKVWPHTVCGLRSIPSAPPALGNAPVDPFESLPIATALTEEQPFSELAGALFYDAGFLESCKGSSNLSCLESLLAALLLLWVLPRQATDTYPLLGAPAPGPGRCMTSFAAWVYRLQYETQDGFFMVLDDLLKNPYVLDAAKSTANGPMHPGSISRITNDLLQFNMFGQTDRLLSLFDRALNIQAAKTFPEHAAAPSPIEARLTATRRDINPHLQVFFAYGLGYLDVLRLELALTHNRSILIAGPKGALRNDFWRAFTMWLADAEEQQKVQDRFFTFGHDNGPYVLHGVVSDAQAARHMVGALDDGGSVLAAMHTDDTSPMAPYKLLAEWTDREPHEFAQHFDLVLMLEPTADGGTQANLHFYNQSDDAHHVAKETILERIGVWAGDRQKVLTWYNFTPIPAFGDKTADALVRAGKISAVIAYLKHIDAGGFA